MIDSVTEDRMATLQIYCQRSGLAPIHPTDSASMFMDKVHCILGEMACELDALKHGLRIAGRERK